DYGCREESAVRVHRNTIEGFNYGLLVGRVCGGTEQELSDIEVHDNYFASNGGGGGGGAVWVRASGGGVAVHYNGFSGNYCGVKNTAAAQVDARYNWWGDPSGPTVPGRGGDPIEGDVLYDPFYTANLVCVPDPMKLNLSAPDGTVTVKYLGGGSHPIFGYSVTFAWDGDVVSTTRYDVDEGPFMAETCDTYFAVSVPPPAHTLVVDCAMLCEDTSILGVAFPGDLFSIDFSAVGSGTSPVDLEIVSLVTRERNGVTGVSEDDGEIQVDVVAPTVSSVHIANLTLIHTDDYVKDGDDLEVTAVVTDDEGVDKEDILADLSVLLDGGDTAVEPDSYDGTVATWTVPLADVTLAADGTRLVTVNATDRLGNPAAAGSDGIIVDNTPPTSPSDFAAAPGHQTVQLGWTNGSDDHYAGVKIVYNRWGAYPEYGSNNGSPRPSPDYPTAHSDPDVAFAAAGTSYTWSQTDRDIYFFSAFSYDEARNYCAIPDTASATNYWLGDVNGDGAVGTGDISVLASSYYEPEGGGAWDNRCDVGPTHNGSRLGLPYPDDQVQFEDLMIFAMNFGVVAPQALPPVGVPPTETTGAVALRLVPPASVAPGAELSVPVYLEDARGVVQGVHFAVGYDARTLQYLGAQPGALVQGCGESFFMPVVHEGQPVVDAAALGDGATFGRSGELAVLRFRCTGEGSLALRLEGISARNVLNEDLFAETSDVVSGPEARIPAEVFLGANRPNPAQGGTGIVFGLPGAAEVRLAVYDVSGRAVRTLVSGSLAAGEHAIVWDGRDEGGRAVSGGVYLYRLETQGRTITRKMVVTE
ncbi:MAG: T9SS type A sorting domain-containing protein, partial [Candidatus Eisenbacteria bacterium]|nr:T9SS type A sorting domain-containing protein [Candidatus Eisenbacteria bacterium]